MRCAGCGWTKTKRRLNKSIKKPKKMVITDKVELKQLLNNMVLCGMVSVKTSDCILHLATTKNADVVCSVSKLENLDEVSVKLEYHISTCDEKHIPVLYKYGKRRIYDLPISARLHNRMCDAVRRYKLRESYHQATLSDFQKVSTEQLFEIRGFGKKTLHELECVMNNVGLKLKE